MVKIIHIIYRFFVKWCFSPSSMKEVIRDILYVNFFVLLYSDMWWGPDVTKRTWIYLFLWLIVSLALLENGGIQIWKVLIQNYIHIFKVGPKSRCKTFKHVWLKQTNSQTSPCSLLVSPFVGFRHVSACISSLRLSLLLLAFSISEQHSKGANGLLCLASQTPQAVTDFIRHIT